MTIKCCTGGICSDNPDLPWESSEDKPRRSNPWSTGICDCHKSPMIAFMTAFCPCITFGLVADVLGDDDKSVFASNCLCYLFMMACCCSQIWLNSCCHNHRQQLRMDYGLKSAPLGDGLTHICCHLCALCQEYRELNIRGRDLAIGWRDRKAKQQQESRQTIDQHMTPPPSNQ